MSDKLVAIDKILQAMNSCWDLPPDCNEGELFTYAEVLFDRIKAGEGRDSLYTYLSGVQTDKLDMPASEAFRQIVDLSFELIGHA